MKYFRNTELSKLYNVSEKTVRNWVEATQQGKLDLQLHNENDKYYIADISKNHTIVDELVTKGKKYKNTRGYKTIRPKPEFYQLFNSKEVYNITSNLDVYHEIPMEYSYFGEGAKIWDAYVQRLSTEQTPSILSGTTRLLNLDTDYIDSLLEGYDRVNVVDVGPGNGYPVRHILEWLIKKDRLNRYIAIDASREMLNIVEHNMREWFGDTISFESYVRDVTYERFGNLLIENSSDEAIMNVVLFLGSTLSNFRDASQPLDTIRESMGKGDVLIISKQLDTPHSRRHFDFYTGNETDLQLTPKSKFVLDLFSVNGSLYEADPFFDEATMLRGLRVRLKIAISIEFKLGTKVKVINFNKGDTIMVGRHQHQNELATLKHFDNSGFQLRQATILEDKEYMLGIFMIKTSR